MGNRILFRDEDFPLRSLLNLSELNFNRSNSIVRSHFDRQFCPRCLKV